MNARSCRCVWFRMLRPAVHRQTLCVQLRAPPSRPFAVSSPAFLAKPSSKTAPALQNRDIPYPTVTVISAASENLGAHPLSKALTLYDNTTHDLVLVNNRTDPPVCRIIARENATPKSSTFVKPPKNEKIPQTTVEVLSEENESLGTHSLEKALTLFNRRTHDLLLISPDKNPPICRIVSHEVQKKAKAEARGVKRPKDGKSNTAKELEVGSSISPHDLNIKLTKARQLLEDKYRVRFTIVDKRNRKSEAVLKHVSDALQSCAQMVGQPTSHDRKLVATFVSNKK
ncbi:translation initiation factor IF-3 [Spizellomyces punctatus DAOM BR117]|uniref:Translation initiation factor IF-3 n=1 Tax=Spizellomyces punctatus (strain DAOM BR117) TaxID=645134 RepID=A0A0L0HL55_SPIPD|nr:translation initiation factor IF-3 [Spizellomyces punctatus DAOM BR117]KND01615.1 translation initiation factor IF-3 [Spizellomyces punctatus DAOM BR117]|eukprot:XP_016609654.1 translation initiation factor IF-3 [Spizellomyces punctatus DAOM BR117]